MGPYAVIILLLFIGVLAWRVVRRGYQMRDLVQRGVPVTGAVLNKQSFHGKTGLRSRYLRYRFRAADGREYSHRIAVSPGEDERYDEGRPIELVYLPDDPRVSASADMVALAREALAKRR